MTTETAPNNKPTEVQGEKPARAGTVYALGAAFIILMALMYIKADLFLDWLEAIVRTLFM